VPSNETDKLPSGSEWLHEIKHDVFGLLRAKRAHRCGSTAVLATISRIVSL
jgi:hypothetical protein